jgi:hypothetical protein
MPNCQIGQETPQLFIRPAGAAARHVAREPSQTFDLNAVDVGHKILTGRSALPEQK